MRIAYIFFDGITWLDLCKKWATNEASDFDNVPEGMNTFILREYRAFFFFKTFLLDSADNQIFAERLC